MQSQLSSSLGNLFALGYLACVIAIVIFVLKLLWRFVVAHERMAVSLDVIARKLKDEDRQ